MSPEGDKVFWDSLIGTRTVFNKTITESDVVSFAQISGDNHPNHTDHNYAICNGLGGRVAQGALLVGLIAGASSAYLANIQRPAVSYGYDSVRFIKLVYIGDEIRVFYTIVRADPIKRTATAKAELRRKTGELVAVGINILHFS